MLYNHIESFDEILEIAQLIIDIILNSCILRIPFL